MAAEETIAIAKMKTGMYRLPEDTLARYHALLSKKFSEEWTPEEQAELEELGHCLDEADAATPLERHSAAQSEAQYLRVSSVLGSIIKSYPGTESARLWDASRQPSYGRKT